MSSVNDLKKIVGKFNTEGPFHSGNIFGTGHIHDTYKIKTGKGYRDYLLQRINNKVFLDIPDLQENILRVTRHIHDKLLFKGEKDIERKCLTLVETDDGKTWYRDDKGGYWRMFYFIPEHCSYEVVSSNEQAFEGGKAIGRFQALLSDLPGPMLNETIPDFHNIEKRLETFHQTLQADPVSRVKSVSREIDFVIARQEEMKIIMKLGRQGKIPLRITHNDTKFNNILFDKSDRALCLIDLDTVMPGYVHYDFGDSLRTAANKAAEDEADLSMVNMNLNIYKYFTKGYLQQAGNILNKTEIEHLAFGPVFMTFIMGLRFLTDYIMGDVYYKISRPDHNIIRARAQFRLVESFEENLDTMKSIIYDYIG